MSNSPIYCNLYVQFQTLRKAIYHIFLMLSVLSIVSCTPPTIEQQIEDLLQETNVVKRKKISMSLADSLDPRAIELLSGLSTTEPHRVHQALVEMLFRYSVISDTSDETLARNAVECMQMITEPNYPSELSNESKIEVIIDVLSLSPKENDLQITLIESSLQHGDSAMFKLIDAWYDNKGSAGILNAIRAYGDHAVYFLSDKLGSDDKVEELLAHIGGPAVAALMSKMESSEQDVRFAAADALVQMSIHHPTALNHLTGAIQNGSVGVIARNYPFYIRLGQHGSEELVIDALRNNFSENMCLDFLNCGNNQIETAANEIAFDNGFIVYSSIGSHYGPKWGSGN